MVEDWIGETEVRLAKQGAMSAARSARGLVSTDELVAEANLWMVSHIEKVVLWKEQGTHGKNKLRNACRQYCLNIVAKERRRRSALQPGDLHYYTPAMVRELLPVIWDQDDWVSGQHTESHEAKAPARPSEGNNRLAMIIDVRAAFFDLKIEDQYLIACIYRDNRTWASLAEQYEVHERTIRRREERAVDRMVEFLGGEPPWKR